MNIILKFFKYFRKKKYSKNLIKLKSLRDELNNKLSILNHKLSYINNVLNDRFDDSNLITHPLGNKYFEQTLKSNKSLIINQINTIESYNVILLKLISNLELSNITSDVNKNIKIGNKLVTIINKSINNSYLNLLNDNSDNSLLNNHELLSEYQHLIMEDNRKISDIKCNINSKNIKIEEMG